MLDDTEARVVKLNAGLVEGEASRADLKTKIAQFELVNEELCEKVGALEAENVGLRGELDARSTPSPEPDVKELKVRLTFYSTRVRFFDLTHVKLEFNSSQIVSCSSKKVRKPDSSQVLNRVDLSESSQGINLT